MSIVCGGNIQQREYVMHEVRLGVFYSWLHAALHREGVPCITPGEFNRRMVSAEKAVEAAKRALQFPVGT